MLKLEMRISPRLVQQVGAIERFAGVWERLSQSDAVAPESMSRDALRAGCEACTRLDTTSPAGLSMMIEIESTPSASGFDGPSAGTKKSPLQPLIDAHVVPAEFDLNGLQQLYTLITSGKLPLETEPPKLELRKSTAYFTATGLANISGAPRGDDIVFLTVSSFLVEQRLTDLLEWTRHELEEGSFHPLFIVGTFHLLFLQISPFPTANHRLALVLLYRLLDAHGYSFVRYRHFAPEMEARSKQYFAALRQAEKTACGNWSTLNIWLEFFLDTLIQASNALLDFSERTVNTSRLTGVQRKIMDVVKTNGSATRERIVTETGINLSTVKYNLSVLASRGHLKRDGGGRTTSYRVL